MKHSFLVVGPQFYGYTSQIAAALRSAEHRVMLVTYAQPLPAVNALLNRASVFAPIGNSQELYVSLIWRQLLKKWRSGRYSALLIIRPDLVSEKRLECLRDSQPGAEIAAWMTDPLEKYPITHKKISLMDRLFLYNEDESKTERKKHGAKISFLPMGFDDSVYIPSVRRLEPTRSLAFVGSLSGRASELAALISRLSLHKTKTHIYAGRHTFLSRLLDGLRPVETGKLQGCYVQKRDITPIAANTLYQTVGLCLNIHRNDTKPGLNPRTFEIAGAGGFQLARNTAGLGSVLEPDREIITYECVDEMVDKAEFYLARPRLWTSIRDRATLRAHECHSFKSRVKTLIELL